MPAEKMTIETKHCRTLKTNLRQYWRGCWDLRLSQVGAVPHRWRTLHSSATSLKPLPLCSGNVADII